MVFVDSSVWIAALRDADAPVTPGLRTLLEEDEVALAAPVRLELLSGTSVSDLPRLRRTLDSLPLFYPSEEAWTLIESWIDRAVATGHRFGVGDLLIGAIASEQSSPVWSLDGDFERMARLGFLGLYRPQ